MTDFEQSYPSGAAHAASELDKDIPPSWAWSDQTLADKVVDVLCVLTVVISAAVVVVEALK